MAFGFGTESEEVGKHRKISAEDTAELLKSFSTVVGSGTDTVSAGGYHGEIACP